MGLCERCVWVLYVCTVCVCSLCCFGCGSTLGAVEWWCVPCLHAHAARKVSRASKCNERNAK